MANTVSEFSVDGERFNDLTIAYETLLCDKLSIITNFASPYRRIIYEFSKQTLYNAMNGTLIKYSDDTDREIVDKFIGEITVKTLHTVLRAAFLANPSLFKLGRLPRFMGINEKRLDSVITKVINEPVSVQIEQIGAVPKRTKLTTVDASSAMKLLMHQKDIDYSRDPLLTIATRILSTNDYFIVLDPRYMNDPIDKVYRDLEKYQQYIDNLPKTRTVPNSSRHTYYLRPIDLSVARGRRQSHEFCEIAEHYIYQYFPKIDERDKVEGTEFERHVRLIFNAYAQMFGLESEEPAPLVDIDYITFYEYVGIPKSTTTLLPALIDELTRLEINETKYREYLQAMSVKVPNAFYLGHIYTENDSRECHIRAKTFENILDWIGSR